MLIRSKLLLVSLSSRMPQWRRGKTIPAQLAAICQPWEIGAGLKPWETGGAVWAQREAPCPPHTDWGHSPPPCAVWGWSLSVYRDQTTASWAEIASPEPQISLWLARSFLLRWDYSFWGTPIPHPWAQGQGWFSCSWQGAATKPGQLLPPLPPPPRAGTARSWHPGEPGAPPGCCFRWVDHGRSRPGLGCSCWVKFAPNIGTCVDVCLGVL